MGSYVLVSHQSQACSSHRTEPCITTRIPWLGNDDVQSQSKEKYEYNRHQHSQEIYEASPVKNVLRSRQCTEGRNWRREKELLPKVVGVSIVKRFETGMQYDIKTLQEDVGMTRRPS